METQYINTDQLTRSRLEVKIVRAKSPLLFWVQLKNSERDLQELEEELNLRMYRRATYLHIWPEQMKEGMDVAVQSNKSWRRGFINKMNKNTWMVQVSLGDWGRVIWRKMSEVYLLEDRFRELPWQTIVCGLAYTGPALDSTIWPTETRELCRLLLEEHKGWINIVHPLRDGAALVKLCMQTQTTENTSYNFRDALIRLGHARLADKVTVDTYPAV